MPIPAVDFGPLTELVYRHTVTTTDDDEDCHSENSVESRATIEFDASTEVVRIRTAST